MAMITTQDILALLAKEKKGISPSRLVKKHSIPDPSFGTRFRDMEKRKQVRRIGQPKGASKNEAFYEITATGKKFLAENKASVQSVAQLIKNCTNKEARTYKTKAPNIPMNGKANAAIDSISKLMDDYNHANQMLKQIHAMIGNYLANNSGETSNEQKP